MTGQGAPPERIRVVGTGLIGTSVGLAARAAGLEVLLHDTDPGRLAVAVARGAGREAPGETADLVVIAAPPSRTGALAADTLRHDVGAIVTHTCSVQTRPQAHVESSGSSLKRFVGGHPIAGRERSGPESAAADLFRDRPWVVCPTTDTDARAVEAVAGLARACGAYPVRMSAEEHDRVFARLSHVPQLVASALAAALAELAPEEVALAGAGVRDTTRLADSDPTLWAEIVAANPVAVAAGLRAAVHPLLRVAAALDDTTAGAEVEAAVAELVARGREGRALLPGKHGRAPTVWATVAVVIPDQPGALADLLAAVATHDVNLEDLRVDHAPGNAEGLAELAVAPGERDRLTEQLRASGWTVRSSADAEL